MPSASTYVSTRKSAVEPLNSLVFQFPGYSGSLAIAASVSIPRAVAPLYNRSHPAPAKPALAQQRHLLNDNCGTWGAFLHLNNGSCRCSIISKAKAQGTVRPHNPRALTRSVFCKETRMSLCMECTMPEMSYRVLMSEQCSAAFSPALPLLLRHR